MKINHASNTKILLKHIEGLYCALEHISPFITNFEDFLVSCGNYHSLRLDLQDQVGRLLQEVDSLHSQLDSLGVLENYQDTLVVSLCESSGRSAAEINALSVGHVYVMDKVCSHVTLPPSPEATKISTFILSKEIQSLLLKHIETLPSKTPGSPLFPN